MILSGYLTISDYILSQIFLFFALLDYSRLIITLYAVIYLLYKSYAVISKILIQFQSETHECRSIA